MKGQRFILTVKKNLLECIWYSQVFSWKYSFHRTSVRVTHKRVHCPHGLTTKCHSAYVDMALSKTS